MAEHERLLLTVVGYRQGELTREITASFNNLERGMHSRNRGCDSGSATHESSETSVRNGDGLPPLTGASVSAQTTRGLDRSLIGITIRDASISKPKRVATSKHPVGRIDRHDTVLFKIE